MPAEWAAARDRALEELEAERSIAGDVGLREPELDVELALLLLGDAFGEAERGAVLKIEKLRRKVKGKEVCRHSIKPEGTLPNLARLPLLMGIRRLARKTGIADSGMCPFRMASNSMQRALRHVSFGHTASMNSAV